MYWCDSEASEYKGWVIKLVLTTPVISVIVRLMKIIRMIMNEMVMRVIKMVVKIMMIKVIGIGIGIGIIE